MNRLVVEGTRALLMSLGLSERWWPLAISQWACCYNATFIGKDGHTPWERHFGQKADFTVYPFGALVMFKPAGPGIKLVDDDTSSGKKQAKKAAAGFGDKPDDGTFLVGFFKGGGERMLWKSIQALGELK